MTIGSSEASPGERPPGLRRLLPPPPTRAQLSALVLALLFVAGAIGYAVGSRPSHPGADSIDAGFLRDMIAHHEQAITMSNLELENGADPGVMVFAREIATFQSYEIGLMERQLAQWGQERSGPAGSAMGWMNEPVAVQEMPGMASEAELRSLMDAEGRAVDALFIPLMQDHHRGGAHMAEYAAANAGTEFVRELAARMARNQRVEIAELEQARERAGLPASPAGYVPAPMPAGDQPPSHH